MKKKIKPPSVLKQSTTAHERAMILRAIEAHGTQERAAQSLGITRQTLGAKLRVK